MIEQPHESIEIIEEQYKRLLNQYNSDKEQMKANQSLYNAKLCRFNELITSIAEAEATLQLLQLDEEDDQVDLHSFQEQLHSRISLTQKQLAQQENLKKSSENLYQQEIQEKAQCLSNLEMQLQKLKIQETEQWNLEREKAILENLNHQIESYNEKISDKFILKEELADPIAFERIQSQVEDYSSAQRKLEQEVDFKSQEEKIARNKVVIEYNKYENLKEKKQQFEQDLRALKNHSEEIGTRISAMRKEEKKVNDSLKKNKKLIGTYPVREQIMITQKENQILQLELTKEQRKLQEVKKNKEKSVKNQEFQRLKKQHENLKDKSDLLHKDAAKNKKLKEVLKRLSQQFETTKESEEKLAMEKKNHLKNHLRKIDEMEEERNSCEKAISQDSNLLIEYINQLQRKKLQQTKEQASVQSSLKSQVEQPRNGREEDVKLKDMRKEKYSQLTIITILAVITMVIMFR